MTFDRPDLATLLARARADIESRLPETDAGARRSLLGVVATVHAGGLHGLYGYLDFLSKQIMPDSAEAEFLARWSGVWNITRTQAAKATGTATMTGTTGSVVPLGTLLRRADGVEYAVTSEIVLVAGTATVPLQAVEPGSEGNAASGTKLSLSSPIAGVQSVATGGELSGGADEETDASLRGRLLARIRQAPHGGADFDYVSWALAEPGVTRAWVYPRELGIGTVSVRVMTDDTTIDGIPSAETIAAVQAALDASRPVTADLYVVAPVAVAMNPQININPNTTTVQAAIEAELLDLLRREAEPGGTILISHLREAVSIAAGEHDHALASPTADVEHATGEIAVLGTITWGDL